MASEQAQRDGNRVPGLLIHNSDGTETRQVRGTAANPNSLPVEIIGNNPATAYTPSNGRAVVTTAGTAAKITAGSTPVDWVMITAETDNTGIVAVGASDVVAALATRKGVPLNPGDTIVLPNVDLTQVYIDSQVNGDGVTYTALT